MRTSNADRTIWWQNGLAAFYLFSVRRESHSGSKCTVKSRSFRSLFQGKLQQAEIKTSIMSNSRVILITGASTGLGAAMAAHFLKAGHIVVATARDVSKVVHFQDQYPNRALAIKLDVTDPKLVNAAVEETIAKFGRIDVLINNAGYGQFGAFEELTEKQIHDQMNTNFFGLVRMTQKVLPIMRIQKSGQIIQISSSGGQITVPGLSIYHASKFALEGLSEAISKETAAFNVKVTIVEPGGFKTDFAGRSFQPEEVKLPEYAPSVGKVREMINLLHGKEAGDPVKAAAAILKVIESSKPPLRLLLGSDAYQLVTQSKVQHNAEIEEWKHVTLSTDFEHLNTNALGQVMNTVSSAMNRS